MQHVTFWIMSWNSKINLNRYTVVFTLSVKLLSGVPWANVLLSTGQQAPNHEERRHPDTQPQDVQQVQEEQASRGRLRWAIQMHAGQGLTLWRCTRPDQPHDPHGSPSSIQPLGTHAAYSHAHSPFIWSPPPLQSFAGLGWASLRPLQNKNSSVCRSHHVAINTKWLKAAQSCSHHVQWLKEVGL